MLSKLIKYDIKSTWREFAGIYLCILLGVIIVALITNNANSEIVNMSVGLIVFAIFVTVAVVTIMSLFKIYNTNVFSKEGYLTMTLPVTSGQIITSKLFVSSMWIMLTGLVSVIGFLIFSLISDAIPLADMLNDIKKLLSLIGDENTPKLVVTIILIVVSTIISTVKDVAKLFLSCSIAHLKQLNRFRIPAGILSFFIFTWIEVALVQFATFMVALTPNRFSDFIQHTDSMKNPTEMIGEFWGFFNLLTGIDLVYTLLLIAAFSLGTVWILNRKLDLD